MRASEHRRGRRAVVLAGIAAGMVLVLGLLYWKDFLVRYHMIRLRADPAHLRAAILEPEGSLARVGLSLYLETEEGKDRLARAYFDACDAWCDALVPWTRGEMAILVPWTRWEKAKAILQVDGRLCVVRARGPVTTRDVLDDERDRFMRSSAPFLASLRGRSFRPDKNPEVKVSFLPAPKLSSLTGFSSDVIPEEELAAMKAVTALLIEPVE